MNYLFLISYLFTYALSIYRFKNEAFINTLYFLECMKLPKSIKKHCPHCKTHTEHKVSMNKRKQASSLTFGSKYRAMDRGKARGTGNLGRYSKPAVTKFKMTGAKTTKKTDLRYACVKCKKVQMQSKGIRAKRVEFI